MKNCINCGAVLKGDICEYCGTRYKDEEIQVDLGENNMFGEFKFGGQTYRVYLAAVEANLVSTGCIGRDIEGNVYLGKPVLKHKWELVEM